MLPACARTFLSLRVPLPTHTVGLLYDEAPNRRFFVLGRPLASINKLDAGSGFVAAGVCPRGIQWRRVIPSVAVTAHRAQHRLPAPRNCVLPDACAEVDDILAGPLGPTQRPFNELGSVSALGTPGRM